MLRNTSVVARSARLCLAVLFACLVTTPAAAHAATLVSDKDDYIPGQTVVLSGTGWEPGETVEIVLVEEPLTHENDILISVADADGNFINDDFVVSEHELGVTFTATATGLTSGLTASTVFTDGPCGSGTLQPGSPNTEACDDGGTANGDGCSSTCKV